MPNYASVPLLPNTVAHLCSSFASHGHYSGAPALGG